MTKDIIDLTNRLYLKHDDASVREAADTLCEQDNEIEQLRSLLRDILSFFRGTNIDQIDKVLYNRIIAGLNGLTPYYLTAKVTALAYTCVEAKSLEEAIEKAKNLQISAINDQYSPSDTSWVVGEFIGPLYDIQEE